MLVLEQARLGHKIHRNDIRGVGTAVVPDLVRLFGVFLPFIPGQATVQRVKGCAIRTIQGIETAVTVQEIEAGAAVETVVVRSAQDAVQTGVLNVVFAVTVTGAELTGIRVHKDAELGEEFQRSLG